VPLQPNGSFELAWASWPPGVPAGATFLFQAWVPDPTASAGFSASNALGAIAPILP
jgi:hypothetical protein